MVGPSVDGAQLEGIFSHENVIKEPGGVAAPREGARPHPSQEKLDHGCPTFCGSGHRLHSRTRPTGGLRAGHGEARHDSTVLCATRSDCSGLGGQIGGFSSPRRLPGTILPHRLNSLVRGTGSFNGFGSRLGAHTPAVMFRAPRLMSVGTKGFRAPVQIVFGPTLLFFFQTPPGDGGAVSTAGKPGRGGPEGLPRHWGFFHSGGEGERTTTPAGSAGREGGDRGLLRSSVINRFAQPRRLSAPEARHRTAIGEARSADWLLVAP